MRESRINWIAFCIVCTAMFSLGGEGRCQSRGHFINVRKLDPVVNNGGALAPSISADGLTLYFGSGREGNRDLYQATRPTLNEAFGDVMNLGTGINGPAIDRAPVVSSDGMTLYFSSTRAGGLGSDDIYQATRRTVDDPFGDVMNLGTLNTRYDDRPEHISPDGKTLYFESTRPGGEGRFDFYMATRENLSDPFTDVANLGDGINGPTSDFAASVSSDGLTMFFSDRLAPFRPAGEGIGDIWVAVRASTDEQFGDVVNLDDFGMGSDVNGRLHDSLPSISSDWPAFGSQLYFNANALSGPYDIWQATWVPDTAEELVSSGEHWRLFRGTEEPSDFPQLAWTTTEFDDASWDVGQDGFGYGRQIEARGVTTELEDMRDSYGSVYLRHEFGVDDPDALSDLFLEVDYDDALIAYINGVEIGRSDLGTAGTPERFDTQVPRPRRETGPLGFGIDLASYENLLQPGEQNILAIHGVNRRPSDSDFVLAQIQLLGIPYESRDADCNGDGVADVSDVNCACAAGDIGLANQILKEIGSITGDANGNGTVDFQDFLILSNNFGKPGQYTDGDFDWNGTVEFSDFLVLADSFGDSGTSVGAAVPEPTGIYLAMFGILGLIGYRRRR